MLGRAHGFKVITAGALPAIITDYSEGSRSSQQLRELFIGVFRFCGYLQLFSLVLIYHPPPHFLWCWNCRQDRLGMDRPTPPESDHRGLRGR